MSKTSSLYRCMSCRKRTEFVDEPPCNTEECNFVPQAIPLLHRFDRTTGTIACTGKPPSNTKVQFLHQWSGVNCIRCRKVLMDQRRPSPSQETVEVEVEVEDEQENEIEDTILNSDNDEEE